MAFDFQSRPVGGHTSLMAPFSYKYGSRTLSLITNMAGLNSKTPIPKINNHRPSTHTSYKSFELSQAEKATSRWGATKIGRLRPICGRHSLGQ